MNNDVHTWVTYGLLRCARAYAWAALVNGPSLSQKLSVGTLLGVGTCSGPGSIPLGAFAELLLLLVESGRRWRNVRSTPICCRKAVLHVKQTAIVSFCSAAGVVGVRKSVIIGA